MTRYRPLTVSAVRRAAVRASARTGTTTTLDVKRALRARGFWATQRDVSRAVAHLATREGWPWWKLGAFRLYAVPREGQAGMTTASRAALVN